ncbi:hypothetical protein B0T10DRAFT_264285 [Thelonectria olida]|uniref:Secreted protein n=1 Tax=Thelonectria olida TaxID=1576542 RepID=A0A9P9AS38_9HYPO|nr:hypothetical protein B0T10DRAFT_264285 [Thelonectria olida]
MLHFVMCVSYAVISSCTSHVPDLQAQGVTWPGLKPQRTESMKTMRANGAGLISFDRNELDVLGPEGVLDASATSPRSEWRVTPDVEGGDTVFSTALQRPTWAQGRCKVQGPMNISTRAEHSLRKVSIARRVLLCARNCFVDVCSECPPDTCGG